MASVNCKDIIGTENCFTSMNKSINKDWFFFFPLLVFSETAPEVTQEQEQEELGGGAKLLEQGIEDKVLKKKRIKCSCIPNYKYLNHIFIILKEGKNHRETSDQGPKEQSYFSLSHCKKIIPLNKFRWVWSCEVEKYWWLKIQ